MIVLTRLNGSRFVVNAEMIRTVEQRPDTTLVLVNGETLIVKESMEDVVAKAIEYGRMIRMFQP
ncbi:MAG TPA: flagellar FlbD family protein [Phycisphaerae bacterium]|jgi:flagellar protein FlbD|nr:flagellar FlbD family protein [Phycisphaerae bacterium]HOB74214.1 flagellar FlbD family protein [Phycisphaerae bacterium]HOJ55002.1 flagellar FlbD family protein [Phycisphaerae bacterium]HOL26977.1 flagellar FlbD family protein [Phycisphaerae bacterium]HPP21406.1 flagellar FlbD family protein [Phycisphaerae bacterium]